MNESSVDLNQMNWFLGYWISNFFPFYFSVIHNIEHFCWTELGFGSNVKYIVIHFHTFLFKVFRKNREPWLVFCCWWGYIFFFLLFFGCFCFCLLLFTFHLVFMFHGFTCSVAVRFSTCPYVEIRTVSIFRTFYIILVVYRSFRKWIPWQFISEWDMISLMLQRFFLSFKFIFFFS